MRISQKKPGLISRDRFTFLYCRSFRVRISHIKSRLKFTGQIHDFLLRVFRVRIAHKIPGLYSRERIIIIYCGIFLSESYTQNTGLISRERSKISHQNHRLKFTDRFALFYCRFFCVRISQNNPRLNSREGVTIIYSEFFL